MEQLNIKIIGLGEGGARAVNKMLAAKIGFGKQVEYICVGTDENILLTSNTRKNIFLNRDITTLYKNFTDALQDAKLIFIVGGLGSNAARGAVPIITSCAKNFGAVTVAFFCRPFVLENVLRKENAQCTLKNLRGKVDTLFILPAEKLFILRINQPQVSLDELFDVADDIFCNGVKIFLDMLTDSGNNLVLFKWGNAAFGYGSAKNALDAIKAAVKFPILDEDDVKGASIILVRLVGGKTIKLGAIDAVNNFIKARLKPDAEFFSQEDVDSTLGDKIFASIVFTRNTGAHMDVRPSPR